MIYLCIQIPAYRQLARLRKEVLGKAEKAVAAFAGDSGCECLLQDEGAWLYRVASFGATEEIRKKKKTGGDIYSLKETLMEYERPLQGFNLLLDETDEVKPSVLLESLKKRILAGGNDGEFWITGKAVSSFEGIFVTKAVREDLFQVSGVERESEVTERPAVDFLVRERLLREFKEVCESAYFGGNRVRNIVVITNPGDGGLDTVRQGLEDIYAGTGGFWVSTYGTESRLGETNPISRGITECLEFYSITEHLTGVEKRAWERHSRTVIADPEHSPCPVDDRLEVDLFQVLALLMVSYRRWMESILLPPVWLCERYDLLPLSVREACVRTAMVNERLSDLISVFVIQGETVPEEFDAIPHTLLRVPPLDRLEIESKASGYSLEKGELEQMAERVLTSCSHSVVTLFRLLAIGTVRGAFSGSNEEPLHMRLVSLDPRVQKALLHLIEGRLALPVDLSAAYLDQVGIEADAVRKARLAVEEMRLDIEGDREEALAAASSLRRELGIDLNSAWVELTSFLAQHSNDVRVQMSLAAGNAVWISGNSQIGIDLIVSAVERMLQSGKSAGAMAVLDRIDANGMSAPALLLIHMLKLKTAILKSDALKAAAIYGELWTLPSQEGEVVEGQRLLEYSRYHYATGSFQEGLQNAKDALMTFQSYESEREMEAYLFIGLHMLGLSRISEAEAYLQIARESAAEISPVLFILNGIYSATTQFMIGNLTRAMGAISEAKSLADECSLHRYKSYLLMLEVRIQFELGRYTECIDLCLSGLTLCQLYGNESRDVFTKWLRRAEAFSGSPGEAADSLGDFETDREASLFRAEAYYLADRRQAAITCIEESDPFLGGGAKNFKPAENGCWDSGFAVLEDRGITNPGESPVLTMMIRAFRAFLRSDDSDSDSGLNDLARISREDRLSAIDPYNGVYLYYYAHAIGVKKNRNELDRLTALSKAFKSIQERASTMDNSVDKQSYLHNNYFNNLILTEARESNLI